MGELYQAKAELFRMLGHPVRIRVLELLQAGPTPVRGLLAELGVEPSSLSQQLAVLRRSGIITATREGSTVVYALAGGDVADLLRTARRILTGVLSDRNLLLAELRADNGGSGAVPESLRSPAAEPRAVQAPAP
ncbi:ArsR/SmtB family transcription factor [Streptomyces sp. NRRL S-350]|uniref:ArsR/SmtB family transcription factor n=1 Tax=Streptomyces sp. NRRL S-350 TaxID=1463902 RepID=UPI0022772F65|nr:metalloregulator ArsR/SmtB family transcription factor [Streptomyces sp. NRRL S-350]